MQVTGANNTANFQMNTGIITQVDLPTALFTRETVLTFTGMVSATFIICSAAQKAFNFNPKWLALVVSIGLSLLATLGVPKPTLQDYSLAVLNGCLVFLSAAGGAQITGTVADASQKPPLPEMTRATTISRKRFFSKWL